MKNLTQKFEEILKKYTEDSQSLMPEDATRELIQAVKEYNKEVVGEDEETRIASNEHMVKVRAENNLRYEIKKRQEELL